MGAHSKASNYFHSFMSSFISMLDLSYTIYEYSLNKMGITKLFHDGNRWFEATE